MSQAPARIHSVCVYCGSRDGGRRIYREAATGLGRALAAAGLRLVYGGARIGLMGAMADAARAAGGEVLGVIPQSMLDRELAHDGLTDLRIVHSMHERKRLMIDNADAFIALPGGFGTLEELFEALTARQLGVHLRPIVLVDVDDFWRPLIEWAAQLIAARFAKESFWDLFALTTDIDAALDLCEAGDGEPPEPKWF